MGDGFIRANVYVDGFNLYYGALKGTPYRWLDIVALSRQLLPESATVETVKYFSARVSGAADQGAPARQHSYLSALGTLPEVEIHYGNFLTKTIWRPLLNLPVADATIHAHAAISIREGVHRVDGGSLKSASSLPVDRYPDSRSRRRSGKKPRPAADALVAEVHSMEEKGSDVNLAAHLLNDAWKDQFDIAAVISNDTDLVTPIRMVSVERKKPVYVVCPGRWPMSPALERVASYRRHIRAQHLATSLLPDPIPGTTIAKPSGW